MAPRLSTDTFPVDERTVLLTGQGNLDPKMPRWYLVVREDERFMLKFNAHKPSIATPAGNSIRVEHCDLQDFD